MLSAAKHLFAQRDRPLRGVYPEPIRSLRVNSAKGLRACPERSERVPRGDWSNGHALVFTLVPCLNKIIRPPVGADLSRPPPIYRPVMPDDAHSRIAYAPSIIGPYSSFAYNYFIHMLFPWGLTPDQSSGILLLRNRPTVGLNRKKETWRASSKNTL